MGNELTHEGSIAARVTHQHPDWPTNGTNYRFDLPGHAPISWRAAKNADGTLSVWVQGPFNGGYEFRVPMPACPDGQLHIGLRWAKGEISLYLNGQPVKTLAP
jgi:hypothetical protein